MADTPNLDDRRFQDLVDEAKRLVGARPPGLGTLGEESENALIEAAALLVDRLSYQLNQLPGRLHTALLDLVGVRPYPARAARTVVAFWLATPLAERELVIPAGTQVSAPGTDGPTFSTVEELRLEPVAVDCVATLPDGGAPTSDAQVLRSRADGGSPITLSRRAEPSRPGDALFVGLDRPAPGTAVLLDVETRIDGAGVDPNDPPLVWEAWTGDSWAACLVRHDDTGGLSAPGHVVVQLPREHVPSVLFRRRAAWVRCRVVEPSPGQPSFQGGPVISSLSAGTIGGSVLAVHGRLVPEELLGTSTGLAGQRFRLRHAPLVEPDDSVTVEVLTDGAWEPWRAVPTFADSGPDDRHVEIAAGDGEVRFGPAVRHPDGTYRQYGAVPPADALIRIRNHLVGGGRAGNLGPGQLTVLRTAIPYVTRVENLAPGFGGTDAESLDDAKVRIPLMLRTRNRAVTVEDYEYLAREAAPELARVRCVPDPEPGSVWVGLVPTAAVTNGRTPFADLVPGADTLARVAGFLEERRVIGTRLLIEPVFFQGFTVVATLGRGARGGGPAELRERALEALYRYYHPLVGGPDGTGWPFGRPVTIGEVYGVLQRVPGVDLVEDVRLFPADPVTGRRGEPVQRLELSAKALVFSFEHQIRVTDR